MDSGEGLVTCPLCLRQTCGQQCNCETLAVRRGGELLQPGEQQQLLGKQLFERRAAWLKEDPPETGPLGPAEAQRVVAERRDTTRVPRPDGSIRFGEDDELAPGRERSWITAAITGRWG